MKLIYITTIFLIFSLTASSQEYLIDSTYQTSTNEYGDLLYESETKYIYDSEEQLIEIRRSSGYTIFTYPDNQRVITNFDEYGEYQSETRQYYDDNGFEILSESYSGTQDNPQIERFDSTYRNETGLIVRNVSYAPDFYGTIVLDNETNVDYFPNSDIKKREAIYYINNMFAYSFTTENFQNEQEEIELGIRTNLSPYFGNPPEVDSIFYEDNGDYFNSVRKEYVDDIFQECSESKWNQYTMTYREQIFRSTFNSDCTDYTPNRLSKFYLSDGKLFSQDSAKYYNYPTQDQPFLERFQYRDQEGVIGDDQIIVHSKSESYQLYGISSASSFKGFYNKAQIVNTEDQALAELKLNVYPNPVNAGQKITFETDITEYNSIKILDISGRTISHQPANANLNTVLAPKENGIYYVRLFDRLNPASKIVKLIVL